MTTTQYAIYYAACQRHGITPLSEANYYAALNNPRCGAKHRVSDEQFDYDTEKREGWAK